MKIVSFKLNVINREQSYCHNKEIGEDGNAHVAKNVLKIDFNNENGINNYFNRKNRKNRKKGKDNRDKIIKKCKKSKKSKIIKIIKKSKQNKLMFWKSLTPVVYSYDNLDLENNQLLEGVTELRLNKKINITGKELRLKFPKLKNLYYYCHHCTKEIYICFSKIERNINKNTNLFKSLRNSLCKDCYCTHIFYKNMHLNKKKTN